jgi:hypothetical protein
VEVIAAMTLPGLVVILVVVSALEAVIVRRRRRSGVTGARHHVAQVGFDALGTALVPSTRHKLDHDEFQMLRRDDDGAAASPHSRVDLDRGVALLVLSETALPLSWSPAT